MLRRTERRLRTSLVLLAALSIPTTLLFDHLVLPAASGETQSVAPPADDSTPEAVQKLDELYSLMESGLAGPCRLWLPKIARPKYEDLRRILAALEEGEERQ